MDLFKKSTIVGVSVTPEIGLEIAEIDFMTQTVVKYGTRPLNYDYHQQTIVDMDLFKEALQDLLNELDIPKKAKIVLNVPTVVFRTKDYPAALDAVQISNAIEEDLMEHPIFSSADPDISAVTLPNSSMQFYKVAYTAARKQMLMEIVISIKDLGYKIITIDTSLNSIFNALMYSQKIDIETDKTWTLLVIDNAFCRVLSMNGKNYVDAYEERIAIGSVLSDDENYTTIANTVNPILKNIPAEYLCVVSKSNLIKAEALCSKLTYAAPIIYQEANGYNTEPFINVANNIDEQTAKTISLDIIGAAINENFKPYFSAHFNLFNASMGELFNEDQPITINLGSSTLLITNKILLSIGIVIALILIILTIGTQFYYGNIIKSQEQELDNLNNTKRQLNIFLKNNKDISANLFDEGDEIKLGLIRNKNIYQYYTIIGTEMPTKLWLTHLNLTDKVTIDGQADNLESIYAFFRNIRDYSPEAKVKLQELGLASNINKNKLEEINIDGENVNAQSILTSINADFYEFKISNNDNVKQKTKNNKSSSKSHKARNTAPEIELIN